MTGQHEKATDCAQGLLEQLQFAEHRIRRINHQLETALELAVESSRLESLIGLALESSGNTQDWIKDAIAGAVVDVEELHVAPRSAQFEIVARDSEVLP